MNNTQQNGNLAQVVSDYINDYVANQYSLAGSFRIPVSMVEKCLAHIKVVDIKKKDHLFSTTENNGGVFFVLQGVLRHYSITDEGEENTFNFSLPGEFGSRWIKHFLGVGDDTNIDAVTDVQLILMDFKKLESIIAEQGEAYELIYYKYMFIVFAEHHKDIYKLFNLDAKGRYKYILENTDLGKYLPKKYIASYLGIKPETFSRTINKS